MLAQIVLSTDMSKFPSPEDCYIEMCGNRMSLQCRLSILCVEVVRIVTKVVRILQ